MVAEAEAEAEAVVSWADYLEIRQRELRSSGACLQRLRARGFHKEGMGSAPFNGFWWELRLNQRVYQLDYADCACK